MNSPLRRGLALAMLLLLTPVDGAAADSPGPTCARVHSVAASTISNRDKGVSKDAMKSAIPPLAAITPSTPKPQAELLRSMHEILDEVFGDGPVGDAVYPVYRAEVCYRRMKDLPVPASFAEVRPQLLACAARPGDERIPCAMQAAGSKPDD